MRIAFRQRKCFKSKSGTLPNHRGSPPLRREASQPGNGETNVKKSKHTETTSALKRADARHAGAIPIRQDR
jgi:hypothetical protein